MGNEMGGVGNETLGVLVDKRNDMVLQYAAVLMDIDRIETGLQAAYGKAEEVTAQLREVEKAIGQEIGVLSITRAREIISGAQDGLASEEA